MPPERVCHGAQQRSPGFHGDHTSARALTSDTGGARTRWLSPEVGDTLRAHACAARPPDAALRDGPAARMSKRALHSGGRCRRDERRGRHLHGCRHHPAAALRAHRVRRRPHLQPLTNPNFQKALAQIDWGDAPKAKATLHVELTSTCHPFTGWETNPPPTGENWPADCDAFNWNFEFVLDDPPRFRGRHTGRRAGARDHPVRWTAHLRHRHHRRGERASRRAHVEGDHPHVVGRRRGRSAAHTAAGT